MDVASTASFVTGSMTLKKKRQATLTSKPKDFEDRKASSTLNKYASGNNLKKSYTMTKNSSDS